MNSNDRKHGLIAFPIFNSLAEELQLSGLKNSAPRQLTMLELHYIRTGRLNTSLKCTKCKCYHPRNFRGIVTHSIQLHGSFASKSSRNLPFVLVLTKTKTWMENLARFLPVMTRSLGLRGVIRGTAAERLFFRQFEAEWWVLCALSKHELFLILFCHIDSSTHAVQKPLFLEKSILSTESLSLFYKVDWSK